jgi:hypothetical protein
MLRDESFHLQWKPRYGGIMQSAFGYLVRESTWGCRIAELPCEIWNCEQETRSSFSERTKVVHIVGELRHACLHDRVSNDPIVNQLAGMWREFAAVSV